MRKLTLIVTMLACFLAGSAVLAVDKLKTPKKPAEKQQKMEPPEQKKQPDKPVPPDRKSEPDRVAPRDYDNFVDKNNNGIDDRAERKQLKTSSEKKQPERKPKSPPDSLQ